MEIMIKTRVTPRMRVLAFFMAFLIFSLTFTNILDGLGVGLLVNAVVKGPNIQSNTTETGISNWKNMISPSDSKFKYTGNILAQTANVYDYLSDEEITNGWNTNMTQSVVSGYSDPYTQFNKYISDSNGVASEGTSNITIVLQDFGNWAVGTDEVCIFLEDDNGHHNTWYGDRMTYRASDNTFVYTFNGTALGFTPTKIKIYNKKNDGTLPAPGEDVGFRFKDDSANYGYKENGDDDYKAGHTYYIKWRCSNHPNLGEHSHIWEASGAEPIYNCKYTVPLYFGCFLSTGDANDSNNYNEHTAPNYNNFYWRANMAFRADTDASVQKLVDNTLTGGNIKKNNVELPYFKTTNNTVMKTWENKSFPFYEVLTDKNNGVDYVNGTASTDTKAKYYQFNSADTNVYFDGSQFVEQENAVNDQQGSAGYFPFNQSGDVASELNLGFGTKFVMTFKLDSDGKVYTVNDQGKEVQGAGKVNARFEFEGDDDLWVFIDDNLILDMGGAHKKAQGYIDFAEKKAVVSTNGVDFSTSNDCDDLGTTLSGAKELLSDTGFTSKLLGGYDSTLGDDGKEKGYDKSKSHTMTVFYMERGMINSNLLIRFNFAAESNFTKMKIQEQTDFSSVNEGLQNITKKAADSDVFKYSVTNSGTNSDLILDSNALYPTKTNHIRNVQEIQTKLTSTTTPYVSPNTESKSFNFNPSGGNKVKNTSYLWVDKFANMYSVDKGGDGKGAGLTDSTDGFLYLMYGTDSVESSAEFEGQFSRYSMMKVTQNDTLYKPASHNVDIGDDATTFSSTSRKVSDYYDVSNPYIYSRLNVESSGRVVLNNDTTEFVFRNNIKDFTNTNVYSYTSGTDNPDADLFKAVQMTEVFVNTPKVGAITIEKKVGKPGTDLDYTDPDNIISNEDTDESFDFRIQLKKVFGVEGVDVSDYRGIVVKKIKKDGSEDTTFTTLNNYENTSTNIYGTFSLKRGEKLTINKIPVGTEYLITEQSHDNYEQKSTTNSNFETIVKGNLNASNQAVDSNDTVVADRNETVVNVRRVGSLTLNKTVEGNTNETTFTFTGTLQGATGVDLKNYDISGTGVNLGTYNEENRTYPFTATVTVGTATVISGIPYGTKYTVDETLPPNATSRTISGDGGSTGTGTINNNKKDHSVNIKNIYPSTTEVDVEKIKKDDSSTKLAGAEMELWYKETITPDTYTPSERQNVPNALNGMKVSKSKSDVGVPGLQTTTEKTTSYTYKTSYRNPPSVPSSSNQDWILPRNDTDYIYFRDYNTGTPGEWDVSSFNASDKRTWIQTNFANKKVASADDPGTHNQDQELGFANRNLWLEAQFTDSGKEMLKCAVWERFVDDSYANRNTVVWKVQPPDGYTKVRFVLYEYDNDTKQDYCIRTTEEIPYQLGKIYHKKSWGGMYDKQNNRDCYFNVPYESEGYWAPHDDSAQENGIYDKRMETNGTMLQARKYEPTNQKIVFYCNSQEVWHNIHIEFFTDASGTHVNGQAFPGYMMEPYAYTEDNTYRLKSGGVEQYLTYELNIPKDAKYFRINNGIDNSTVKGSFAGNGTGGQSDYAYRTAITPINFDSTVKNGGNYFVLNETATERTSCLDSYNKPKEVALTRNVGTITGLSNENTSKAYKDSNITSDYDYIYFKKTSSDGWNDHVYAYFYGGGKLREDNWQRACYSSWPGVAPTGTEYKLGDDYNAYSTTYNYPVPVSGNNYNGNAYGASILSPESYYTDSYGNTIYKFRMPLGDNKNYDYVVFNDGLKGGNETERIKYNPGYIYDSTGKSATKHYDSKQHPTKIYTGRTNDQYPSSGDQTEYIYIKNSANWQDLHIAFYDSSDQQILQGGHGYVMDYAGNQDNTDYYRMPIPTNAVKFSVNNGIGKANSYTTDKYDIIRLNGIAGDKNGQATDAKTDDDRFVYELKGTTSPTLERLEYSLTKVEPPNTSEKVIPQTEDTSGYTVRKTNNTEDTLNIRDSATPKWDLAIGAASVTFYDSDGKTIGNGAYTMMKTNADTDGYVWYTKKIPTTAASFSVSYVKKVSGSEKIFTTTKYPIYSSTADPTNGNQTIKGDMFYETAGTNELSMINAKPVNNYVDEETYDKRGDNLYLVCNNQQPTMTVTFYANGDNILRSGVTAKYINNDESGFWYSVSIPTGAESFKIKGTGNKYPIYELRSKLSPYEKDYTLGDMQYSYNGSTAELLYPKFTVDKEYILDINEGNRISSKSGLLPVDSSAIQKYANADVGITPATDVNIGSTPLPVLYNTATDDVTYTWIDVEENENYNYIRFDATNLVGTSTPWGRDGRKIYAYFYKNSDNSYDWSWGSSDGEMTNIGDDVWKIPIPRNDNGTAKYDRVIFSNNWLNAENQTVSVNLNTYGSGGFGYKFLGLTTKESGNRTVSVSEPEAVTPKKLAFKNNVGWSAVYAVLSGGTNPTDANGIPLTNTGSNSIWEIDLSNYNGVDYSNNTSVTFINRSGKTTTQQSLSSDSKNWLFTPTIEDYFYLLCSSDFNNNNSDILISINNADWSSGTPTTVLSKSAYKFEITGSTASVKFKADSNISNNHEAGPVDWNSGNNYGAGEVYQVSYNSSTGFSTSRYGGVQVNNNNYGGSWSTYNNPQYPTVQPSTSTPLTYSYQPEDRYGMISTQNTNPAGVLGFNDEDNFITLVIPTTVTTPYIKFYKSTDGSGDAINNATSNASSKGLLLKPVAANDMKLNGTTYTCEGTTTGDNTTYKVRLPKNAKSFTISNGTTTGTAQALYEDLNVKVSDGSLYTSGEVDYVPITNFHHAGTTFEIGSNCNVSKKTLRDGYTVTKQAAMTDPLIPKTDNDYVFFTDTENKIGGSNGTVYAYFYGGADGEYNTYPGIKATTANNGVANTTYTDNDGNKVYMFRVPKGVNGNYPYVIFNNGASSSGTITQAASVTAGKNYVLTTTASGQQYGSTFATTVYPVTITDKADESTVDYTSGSSGYIYIVNNGTRVNNGGTRTSLDDIHVVFYDSNKNVIGTSSPGYKPDKVVGENKQYDNNDVYRIIVPSDAKYFQINNGTKDGSQNQYMRQSEIKTVNVNALYRFVADTDGKPETYYIQESAVPSDLSEAHYLLDVVNVVTESDIEIPTDGTVPVHVATVVTGNDGKTAYIKWVKDYDPTRSPAGSIDTAYIANVEADIGKNVTGTKKVKVVKNGEYYWVESVAPSGYQVNPNNYGFTVPTTTSVTVPDPPNPTGQLTLNKKLKKISADNASITSDEKNTQFTFTVTLTAPVGTKWSDYTLTYTGGNPTSDSHSTTNDTILTRTIEFKLAANETDYFVIGKIPSGTYYSITESSTTNYSDTPVAIALTSTSASGTPSTKSADEISGMIPSNSTVDYNELSYAVTNKRDVGGITLEKVAEGSDTALATAGINQIDTDSNSATYNDVIYTEFTYTVTLTAPSGVDFRDYIKWADFAALGATVTKINGTAVSGTPETDFNNADPLRTIEFTVKVKANNGSKLVKNLPIGTKYTVTEVDPPAAQQNNWSKSGEVTTATEMTATNLNPTVTITNSYGGSEVILTKTAKEKVGTTDIGSPLAGAEFLVYKNDKDSDDTNDVLVEKFTQAKDKDNKPIPGEYNFNNTSGTFNVINEETDIATGMTTGDDDSDDDHYGKLVLKGLPVGDYYLKEIKAPNGYSNLDSNNLKNGVAQPKRVYFSVGENTKTKEITCSDEMAPAYIKLYEHINEYRPTEWGNPTFIFKIKQTGYYAWSTPANEGAPSVWQLTATNSGKEILVALTVNDDGILDSKVLSNSVTEKTFTGWKVESTDEEITVGENRTAKEYQGMFNIDSQGRIRVEPGSYEITRMPVSRYEFVTSAKTAPYDNSGTAGEQIENKDNSNSNKPLKTVTISLLEAGKTVDVHYYDEVGYYDKFSQVDTNVNQFYQLNSTTKANKTIKGIRIADYYQVGTTGTNVDTKATTDNNTTVEKLIVPVIYMTIYKIMSDGSEVEMTLEEKQALTTTNFVVSYEYDSTSGDEESFGNTANHGSDDFLYESSADATDYYNYPSVIVDNAQNYKNGVYTLKATYNGKFTTNFDIVFKRTSS